jgi:hypothetical protein
MQSCKKRRSCSQFGWYRHRCRSLSADLNRLVPSCIIICLRFYNIIDLFLAMLIPGFLLR